MAYVSQFMQLISYISDSYILFSAVLNFSPHGEVEGAYSSTSPQGLVGVGCRASGGGGAPRCGRGPVLPPPAPPRGDPQGQGPARSSDLKGSSGECFGLADSLNI